MQYFETTYSGLATAKQGVSGVAEPLCVEKLSPAWRRIAIYFYNSISVISKYVNFVLE